MFIPEVRATTCFPAGPFYATPFLHPLTLDVLRRSDYVSLEHGPALQIRVFRKIPSPSTASVKTGSSVPSVVTRPPIPTARSVQVTWTYVTAVSRVEIPACASGVWLIISSMATVQAAEGLTKKTSTMHSPSSY